jgi:hypothetical protein
MTFDVRGFLSFMHTGLFKTKGTNYPMTPKRVGWALVFLICFPLLELCTWLGFLLDNLFFAPYKDQEIHEPVFIIGNPRSGTTLLHRLMAQDRRNFLTMQMWEIFFAPSITQRVATNVLCALDRLVGRPAYKLLCSLEKSCQEGLVTHQLALQAPEEDEFILLHAWSSLIGCLFSAVMDRAIAYTRFDTDIPPREKRRIMTYYRRCLQRHLHAHRGRVAPDVHYLAKSPATTPKIDTFYEWFPDAKFIYLVRSPSEMIPSYISVIDLQWRVIADPPTPWASRDYVLDMARHWYTYPLERLARAPEDSYAIVRYDDLVRDPRGTVVDIYIRLGLEMSPAYAETLRQEAERSRRFRSRHRYSLAQWKLTRKQIVDRFRDVFERFGFDTSVPPERKTARAVRAKGERVQV